MQPNDRSEFLKILNGLAAMKPGANQLSPEALNLWWSSMAAWSIDDFRAAAAHLATTCEFMPNPYHFDQLRRAGRPTAGEAWARALRHVRSGNSHNIGDELLDRAVAALGGWRQLGMTTSDGLPFAERRFAEHYAEIQDTTETRDAVPTITNRISGPRKLSELLPVRQ